VALGAAAVDCPPGQHGFTIAAAMCLLRLRPFRIEFRRNLAQKISTHQSEMEVPRVLISSGTGDGFHYQANILSLALDAPARALISAGFA
jgi:hypothetical protein